MRKAEGTSSQEALAAGHHWGVDGLDGSFESGRRVKNVTYYSPAMLVLR
jgi:hypothetical protein